MVGDGGGFAHRHLPGSSPSSLRSPFSPRTLLHTPLCAPFSLSLSPLRSCPRGCALITESDPGRSPAVLRSTSPFIDGSASPLSPRPPDLSVKAAANLSLPPSAHPLHPPPRCARSPFRRDRSTTRATSHSLYRHLPADHSANFPPRTPRLRAELARSAVPANGPRSPPDGPPLALLPRVVPKPRQPARL